MADLMMEAESLRRTFTCLVAVAGISLNVQHREIFGLPGPNGAGTTTIRMLTGQADPSEAAPPWPAGMSSRIGRGRRSSWDFDGSPRSGTHPQLQPYLDGDTARAQTGAPLQAAIADPPPVRLSTNMATTPTNTNAGVEVAKVHVLLALVLYAPPGGCFSLTLGLPFGAVFHMVSAAAAASGAVLIIYILASPPLCLSRRVILRADGDGASRAGCCGEPKRVSRSGSCVPELIHPAWLLGAHSILPSAMHRAMVRHHLVGTPCSSFPPVDTPVARPPIPESMAPGTPPWLVRDLQRSHAAEGELW